MFLKTERDRLGGRGALPAHNKKESLFKPPPPGTIDSECFLFLWQGQTMASEVWIFH